VRPGRLRATAAILLAAAATSGRAGDVPGAAIVLEARIELLGRVSDAAPPRFVLLGDGRVFVGGTDRLQAGRLDKAAMSGLERRVERVRKIAGQSWLRHFDDRLGLSHEELKRDVGWQPEVGLEEGAGLTAEWYRANGWL